MRLFLCVSICVVVVNQHSLCPHAMSKKRKADTDSESDRKKRAKPTDDVVRVTKTDAKKLFLLNDTDLQQLVGKECRNPHRKSSTMTLYSRSDVEAAAVRKHGSLAKLQAIFDKRAAARSSREEKHATEASERELALTNALKARGLEAL